MIHNRQVTGASADAETGSHASHEARSDLRPMGFDPAREDWLPRFVQESNRIEGIQRTTAAHIRAHQEFLSVPVTGNSLIMLVAVLQPNARFRNSSDIPGVRVGNHIAPPSGPHIREALLAILAMHDPWEQHIAYETLHPFTDGNGRSGRALWLHRHHHESFDGWATRRGFLHSFYYHTLGSVRFASAIRNAARHDRRAWSGG